MLTHTNKATENKNKTVAANLSKPLNSDSQPLQLKDERPEAIAQKKLSEVANNSTQVKQLRAMQEIANNSTQVKQLRALQQMVNDNVRVSQQQVFKRKEIAGSADVVQMQFTLDDIKKDDKTQIKDTTLKELLPTTVGDKHIKNEKLRGVETRLAGGDFSDDEEKLMFTNYFSENTMVMADVFNGPGLSDFKANQAISKQAELADVDISNMRQLIIKNIVNKESERFLLERNYKNGQQMSASDFKKFMTQTPLGKTSIWTLNAYRLLPVSATFYQTDGIVLKIDVERMSEENKGLQQELDLTRKKKEIQPQEEKNREYKEPEMEEVFIANEKEGRGRKGGGRKGCYITTACIQQNGLDDDCEELTVLRNFRDTYLLNKTNGNELIDLYYQYAPMILHSIQKRDDEEEILERLYKIIRQCVDAIKNGNNEFAFATYYKMVIELKDEFIYEISINIPSC